MSMLSEQVSAVLTAPIPFLIALVPLGVAMWFALEWAYRSVLNKRKELYELSRLEVDYWKEIAERTAKDQTQQIEVLKKEQGLPVEAKTRLDQLTETTSRLSAQLNALGQANTSVTGPTGPAGPLDWTSSGWKPRNPTDVTGRSG